MSTKVSKEELIEKIKSIIENEKFRLDGYFLCGFPTGAPNQVLQKACEKYVEIVENGNPSEEDTKTLIEALEASLNVESMVAVVNDITKSDVLVNYILEHKDVLFA
ncbi:hypothetical protein [Lentihominibacter sp.]|uniref:hypothetical protein n=1 Tax=Lentihominibacter sp. TaxID=2944216 RepID=UPI003993B08B